MLEGLDVINWSEVKACYVPGEQIPVLIRALTSDNEQIQTEAIEELDSNLWHQGDVYDAAKYAAPFLIELLEVDGVKKKKEILSLLEICAAYSPRGLHTWTPEVEAAIRQGLPAYRRLLDDANVAVRQGAINLFVSSANEDVSNWAEEVCHILMKETDSQIKSDIAWYLGYAIANSDLHETDVARYRDLLQQKADSEQDLYTCIGINIGLMQTLQKQIDEGVLAWILQQIQQLESKAGTRVERLVRLICMVLENIDDFHATSYLVQLLNTVQTKGCMYISLDNLLAKAFEVRNQFDLNNLTPQQKYVIAAILSHKTFWNDSTPEVLARFGLPVDRNLLKQFLANDES